MSSEPTNRTKLNRLPERGKYDQETIYGIFGCHADVSNRLFVRRKAGDITHATMARRRSRLLARFPRVQIRTCMAKPTMCA